MRLIKMFSALTFLAIPAQCLSQQQRIPTAECIGTESSSNASNHIRIVRRASSTDFSFALMDAVQSGFQAKNIYLDVDIDGNGHPIAVSIENPTKYENLNTAAVKYGKSLEFGPSTCNKVKVPIILQPNDDQLSQRQSETREQAQARADVYQAYIASSMSGFSTNIAVTYDDFGQVTSAKLEQSTGNSALNRALVNWAKKQKFPPGKSGSATLPYQMRSKQQ